MQHSKSSDLLLLGAGPAGLALAEACANQGLQVTVLAPEPCAPWAQSYGAFEEDLAGLDLGSAVTSRLDTPLVWGNGPTPRHLDAAYLRFDTPRLQALLLERARRAGVELVDGKAVALDHDERESRVRFGANGGRAAALVVDATGSASPWSARSRKDPLGYQTAYGEWLEVERSPFADGEMSLMDFRATGDAPRARGAEIPTFLYGIPETPTRLFLQETSLAAEKIAPWHLLQSRLAARRERLGLSGARVTATERCVIPLGIGLPTRGGEVLPFGAAAGFVHPATGYQLARALGRAARVAESLAESRSAPRAVRLARAHEALWPPSERRSFQIYHQGLETLLRLDSREMGAFISAFFSLPRRQWLGFMTGRLAPREVLEAMWSVFVRAPSSLRWQLLKGGALASSRNLLPTFS